VLDASDPQSLEGYAYADNSPIVGSDPSGTIRLGGIDTGGGGGVVHDTGGAQSNPSPGDDNQTPKKCTNLWCKAKHQAASALNWADEHKAVIAGTVVGLAVGIGCEAALVETGPVGVVACGALAGAVANMVQYSVETKVEGKGNFSLGGLLIQGAVGAVVGGVGAGLGSVAGAGIKAGVAAVASKVGAKAVADAVETGVSKEAGNVAGGLGKQAAAEGSAKASSGAAKAADECLTHSFAANTAVLMANGATKAISTIEVGDKVLATDPVTGKKTVRTVEVVHVNHDTKMTDVTVTVNGQRSSTRPSTTRSGTRPGSAGSTLATSPSATTCARPQPSHRLCPASSTSTAPTRCMTSPSTPSTRTMCSPATRRCSYTTAAP
jgi:hypothetical protein